jgi:cyclopropane fatty-acyl-phospholipid synthase-like methyltransferase
LARSRLAHQSFRANLINADMLSAFENLGRFDVIYSSFAIHHLPEEQKYELFERIAAHMKADGVFILVDAIRREGESLKKYLERYCNMIESEWIELSQEEKQSACDHIVHNDLVETTSNLLSLARRAGLKCNGDPIAYGPHALFCFTRD